MPEVDPDIQNPSGEPAWARTIGVSNPSAPTPLSPENRLRRAIIATGLCLTAALPSFVIALLAEYDVAALVVGLTIFAGAMIAISWTQEFRSFTRRPFVRRTLFFVYGVRILVSVATPLLLL